ncbi:MAG: hypothetical protein QOE77_532 [Blastocatellia bacterium]|nr:hypothetical protein [Blastocatellia bacterium]
MRFLLNVGQAFVPVHYSLELDPETWDRQECLSYVVGD